MNKPGPDRLNELLEGRRLWSAPDTAPDSLKRFRTEVVDPLRAMEDSRMILIEVRDALHGGVCYEDEVRIVEIADWVRDLARADLVKTDQV